MQGTTKIIIIVEKANLATYDLRTIFIETYGVVLGVDDLFILLLIFLHLVLLKVERLRFNVCPKQLICFATIYHH